MESDQYSAAVEVDLDEIDGKLRPASQMREKLNEEAIRDYASDFKDLPPVTLVYDPAKNIHWVEDGAHRIHAARRLKRKSVHARYKKGSFEDAFRGASRANTPNTAVRVTNADKRHRVEEALKLDFARDWSNRKIADLCGVGEATIRRARPKATASKTQLDDEPARTIGKDGKARSKPRREPGPPAEPKPAEIPPLPDPPPEDAAPRLERKPPPEPTPGPATTPPTTPEAADVPAKAPARGAGASFRFPGFDATGEFDPTEDFVLAELARWPAEHRKTFAFKLRGLCERICSDLGYTIREVGHGA
jgi:hypothetical protein